MGSGSIPPTFRPTSVFESTWERWSVGFGGIKTTSSTWERRSDFEVSKRRRLHVASAVGFEAIKTTSSTCGIVGRSCRHHTDVVYMWHRRSDLEAAKRRRLHVVSSFPVEGIKTTASIYGLLSSPFLSNLGYEKNLFGVSRLGHKLGGGAAVRIPY